MNIKFKRTAFEIEIFYNIINDFTVSFNELNFDS